MFIDSFRFMSITLSNLDDNLFEGIHNGKYTQWRSCLEYMKVEDF